MEVDSSQRPSDIYYITLDAYASQQVLEELWEYDNSEFVDFLTDYDLQDDRCYFSRLKQPYDFLDATDFIAGH